MKIQKIKENLEKHFSQNINEIQIDKEKSKENELNLQNSNISSYTRRNIASNILGNVNATDNTPKFELFSSSRIASNYEKDEIKRNIENQIIFKTNAILRSPEIIMQKYICPEGKTSGNSTNRIKVKKLIHLENEPIFSPEKNIRIEEEKVPMANEKSCLYKSNLFNLLNKNEGSLSKTLNNCEKKNIISYVENDNHLMLKENYTDLKNINSSKLISNINTHEKLTLNEKLDEKYLTYLDNITRQPTYNSSAKKLQLPSSLYNSHTKYCSAYSGIHFPLKQYQNKTKNQKQDFSKFQVKDILKLVELVKEHSKFCPSLRGILEREGFI